MGWIRDMQGEFMVRGWWWWFAYNVLRVAEVAVA